MDDADREPGTQTTREGLDIPIPTRDAVLRDLMKLAPKPDPKPDADERP